MAFKEISCEKGMVSCVEVNGKRLRANTGNWGCQSKLKDNIFYDLSFLTGNFFSFRLSFRSSNGGPDGRCKVTMLSLDLKRSTFDEKYVDINMDIEGWVPFEPHIYSRCCTYKLSQDFFSAYTECHDSLTGSHVESNLEYENFEAYVNFFYKAMVSNQDLAETPLLTECRDIIMGIIEELCLRMLNVKYEGSPRLIKFIEKRQQELQEEVEKLQEQLAAYDCVVKQIKSSDRTLQLKNQ